MRGIFQLKFVAVWAAACLALVGAGCQDSMLNPGEAGNMQSEVRPRMTNGGSGIIQTGYQPYGPNGECLNPGGMPNGHGLQGGPGGPGGEGGAPASLPRELGKTFHPTYIIEPPDTLMIDALRLIPRPPYHIEPLDVLVIQVAETLPNQPIVGAYPVSPEGTINLGYSYGIVRIAGLTLEQAAIAIKDTLRRRLNDPQVAIALASMRAIQQIRGEHLVSQDGTVSLGVYGCVNVTGLTLWQAKIVIERYLARWFLNPEISVTVAGYNSKVYYIIFDGGGYGQQILRLPITGSETVLDAIAGVNGLPPVASRKKLWLARPSPKGCYQILPINWEAITKGGDPETNWQIFPGDRIYVAADPLIALDNTLAKIISPIERVLGLTLLTSATVNSFRSNGNNGGNGGFGF